MEECVRMMQQNLRSSAGTIKKRAKSVYQQRNLGTIKERKKEKRQGQEKEVTGGQTIMQILRMRYGSIRSVARVYLIHVTDLAPRSLSRSSWR